MKRTFDFATIGFRPHTETGEFVTIGLVALDVQASNFGFTLLESRKTGRLRAMFPAARELYREARKRLEAELEAIEKAVNGASGGADVPLFPSIHGGKGGLFDAITNPREGVIFYPVRGRRQDETMEQALLNLRKRFIDRHLLPPNQAVEQEMTKTLSQLLQQARLLSAYQRNGKVGTEEFNVSFPFAHMIEEYRADRVLRPLNFRLGTTTEIYNHGDEWLTRLKRLERMNYRPDQCFFAIRAPEETGTLKRKAFEEIRAEFVQAGLQVSDEENTESIIDFARIPEPENLKLGN